MMKRLALICTFAVSSCYGLYNGNPSLPELPEDGFFIPKECWLGLKVGYLGDYVLSKSMIVHSKDSEASHEISSYSSFMNSGTFSLDFGNRAEFYGVVGGYQMKITQKLLGDNRVHFQSDQHVAWMAGFRAIAAYWGDTYLGADVKGFLCHPFVDKISLNDISLELDRSKISDRQWQIGASVSHKVSMFVPYIGVTYNHTRVKLSNLSSLKNLVPTKTIRLKNKYSFGFVFGFGLTAETGFACNLEARLVEEAAITASADFRF
jgi:hypothetical protein